MKLDTIKLLPETKRLAKQQAAARGVFLYEYLDELVRRDNISVQQDKLGIVHYVMGGVEFNPDILGKNEEIQNETP